MWRVSPYSVFPSLQDSLVHAWFSIYLDGLDPRRWNPDMTFVTRNTLRRQLDQRPGTAPVLAMGYGQGWLTHSALLLDEMDAAGQLLWNLAKYSYDKNMDYADDKRGIDWRKWLWLIPEGTNILPDGRWYRIGDLSNGANQGPAMHALEACAGVDDADPANLRILPRIPKPLTGIEVTSFFAVTRDAGGTTIARLSYHFIRGREFTLHSDHRLPSLAVRLGPFAGEGAARRTAAKGRFPVAATTRVEQSGHIEGKEAYWLWVEGMRDITAVRIALD
jgi:hypothetical protein